MAAEKLVYTDQPIIEIAYEARYSSQQAFTLAFGRLYQCTPQGYRSRGVFAPKQLKIEMGLTRKRVSYTISNKRGEMAA